MSTPPEPSQHLDRVLLLVLFALFLFASPLTAWWASVERAWYLPYLLWFLVIVLAFWLQRRYDAR